VSTIWAGSMYALFIVVGVKHSIAFLLCIVAVVTFFSCLAFGATPVAEDDSVTIDEDISILIDVLANDSDPDGDTLTIASVTVPGHGITSIESSKVRYTPDPDYCGTDSFSYTMTDGGDTATATVTVTINPINDAPVAVDDVVATQQEKPVSFRLQAADVDVDPYLPDQHPLVFQILSSPTHGEISVDLTAVTYELPHTAYVNVTYTPEAGFTGNDRITFSVTDPFGVSDTAVVAIVVGKTDIGILAGT